eukprot:RCo036799
MGNEERRSNTLGGSLRPAKAQPTQTGSQKRGPFWICGGGCGCEGGSQPRRITSRKAPSRNPANSAFLLLPNHEDGVLVALAVAVEADLHVGANLTAELVPRFTERLHVGELLSSNADDEVPVAERGAGCGAALHHVPHHGPPAQWVRPHHHPQPGHRRSGRGHHPLRGGHGGLRHRGRGGRRLRGPSVLDDHAEQLLHDRVELIANQQPGALRVALLKGLHHPGVGEEPCHVHGEHPAHPSQEVHLADEPGAVHVARVEGPRTHSAELLGVVQDGLQVPRHSHRGKVGDRAGLGSNGESDRAGRALAAAVQDHGYLPANHGVLLHSLAEGRGRRRRDVAQADQNVLCLDPSGRSRPVGVHSVNHHHPTGELHREPQEGKRWPSRRRRWRSVAGLRACR